MAPGALILAATLLAATAPPAASRAAIPALLHDGRFDAARAALGPISPASPPEDLFLQAFITYWTAVFDDESPELEAKLEREISTVIDVAEKSGKRQQDPTLSLWAGNGHLVLAGVRASQRRSLSAAFEAKKAKKQLEVAAASAASPTDALFGLGTYNYMADTLPTYVRGLRALLFLPKGDRAGGLAQLHRAADHSPTFGFEARVLLITIYANKHERRYDDAVRQRDLLLRQAPDAVAALYAAARLDLSLARNGSCLKWLAQAEERARALGDVDPVVLRSIDLLKARAEFAALRPDLAAATSRHALATGRGLGIGIKRDLENLMKASDLQAAGIDWLQVNRADAGALAALADAAPTSPLLAMIAGDAALRAGRGPEALRWLERAEAGGLPRGLLGACLLRQGQAADLAGDRARAVTLYKRASETGGFPGRDAPLYYQSVPYRAGA